MPVIILGLSEYAQLAAEVLHQQDIALYGYLAIEDTEGLTEINNIPILGNFNEKNYHKILKGDKVNYCIIEPNSATRANLLQALHQIANRYPINVIHDSVILSTDLDLASGNFIQAYTVIGLKVVIGALNLIGAQVSIESGTQIGNYCTIQNGARIGTNVQIANNVHVGTGAIIGNGVKIGENAVIGAGAVVLRTVPAGATVFGNPAQIVEKQN